jgi:hypothetical protein
MTEPEKKEFVMRLEIETIIKAVDYETAVAEAYTTVKGTTIHITKIEEILPRPEMEK